MINHKVPTSLGKDSLVPLEKLILNRNFNFHTSNDNEGIIRQRFLELSINRL